MYLCKGPAERISWAKTFGMGSSPSVNKEDYLPYDEVWNMFKYIHQKSLHFVSALSNDDLNKSIDNNLFFKKQHAQRCRYAFHQTLGDTRGLPDLTL